MKTIKIWYTEDEFGEAEVLWGRVARLSDKPVTADEIWPGDLVLLSHLPGQASGHPRIACILDRRFEVTARVLYWNAGDQLTLQSMLSVVGAGMVDLGTPDDDRPGVMIVGCNRPVDPEQLAEAIGIRQGDWDGAPDGMNSDARVLADDGERNVRDGHNPPAGPRKPR
jgi:hypothetical protein